MRTLYTITRVILALGLTGFLVWVAVGSEWMRLREVRVVGNLRAPASQLRHLAALPTGDPLVLLDLEAAVSGVERHPWVAEASLRRVFPDSVVLQVRERVATALLLLDGLYLVDEKGEVFRRASAPDLDLPVLTGVAPDLALREPVVARRVVQEALSWLADAASQGVDAAKISELRFDVQSGYTLVLRNGGELMLGFQDRSSLSRLGALMGQGVDLARPLRIDLTSAALAVVTPL